MSHVWLTLPQVGDPPAGVAAMTDTHVVGGVSRDLGAFIPLG